jgi:hypothetical protein
MPKVKGKEQLCSCEKYKTYFKSIQGLGGHTLFDRYSDIENIVNKRIDEKYGHFLAQPVVDGDSITWFSKPYSETPLRLSELQGEKRAQYGQIKNDTLAHYQSAIASLKQQGKNSEAECLEKATKFVNDDFVYCFDGKTVLGIWGMELRNEIREPLGLAMKNSFVKKRKPPVADEPEPVPEPEPQPEEPPAEDALDPEPIPEEPPVNPFTVRFNAGENGTLNGASEYSKFAGDYVTASEVPTVTPKEGYEFTGWDKNPNNYRVTDDTEFTAQYREIPPTVIPVTESWWSRFWGAGKGCLSWLLLLLLLALIFMVIWCCLLKKCNFNFCGCDCEETTIVIPEPKPKPQPDRNDATPTPIIPRTGDVQLLLKWNNYNDLDLSCEDPSGATIWFKNKVSPTGGQLEIDMNAGDHKNSEPIENIYWPSGNAPTGTYKVYLTYYKKKANIDDTPYLVTVKYGTVTKDYQGSIKKSDGRIHICTFEFTNEQ